jgi:hypothetical protein
MPLLKPLKMYKNDMVYQQKDKAEESKVPFNYLSFLYTTWLSFDVHRLKWFR